MPFCKQCGEKHELGRERCSKCGAILPLPLEQIPKLDVKDLPNPNLKRLIAGLIDILIVFFIFFILFFYRKLLIALILRRGLALFIPHLYLLLKDSIEGKSIGKLIVGILVFNEKDKKAAGILDSIIRNWYLAIPFVGPNILALIIGSQIMMGKKRLGEKSSGTVVITDSDYQRLV